MLIGDTVFQAGGSAEYYTPWFPVKAENAVFTYEQIYSTLQSSESITVFTKRHEDAGDAASAAVASFSALGSTRLSVATAENLKDLVRFKIAFDTETEGELLRYRFLPPTWYATGEV